MIATRPAHTALLAVLAVGVLAGCGSDGGDNGASSSGTGAATGSATTPAPSTTTTAPAGATQTLVAYLLRDEKIAPVARAAAETTGVAAAALRALLDGPTDAEREAGLTTAIPDGTTLNGLTITDGLATVDLSSAFDSGAGSASTSARVAQVVATLTRYPSVQRVAFRLDGEPAQAIGGEGVAVDPPLGRAEIEEQTPQILVESPLPGTAIASPLRVSGTANTFEATFQYELLDAEGKPIAKGFGTATSGSGTRGTFDVSVPFDATGAVELHVYESSAEDGSAIHEVRIPLRIG
jgi:germination protein M